MGSGPPQSEPRVIWSIGRAEPLIERYTLPEMGGIWTEDAKFQSWLDVEVAVCEAQSELGRVPAEALATIKEKAAFSRHPYREASKPELPDFWQAVSINGRFWSKFEEKIKFSEWSCL